MTNTELAEEIVDVILVELGDRNGIGDTLEEIDIAVYEDIENTLTTKVEELLDIYRK